MASSLTIEKVDAAYGAVRVLEEVTFDVKLGRLRKMVTTLAMPMTMSMTGPDGSNINLQASSKATTTVELIEK